MSQKDESKPDQNKWQAISENADEEHLLVDAHSTSTENQADQKLENKLIDRINLLEKEEKEHKEKILRLHAEWENTRRRLERDVANAHKFGSEKLVSELLPVIDSLTRALENKTDDHPNIQTMRHGIELTIEMLSKVLEKHGVIEIKPKIGDTFDPTQHEAMSMQTATDAKSNAVLQVLQKGYALNGRVIRAAMVMVAA
ncbi:MAG: heat shock protein GrpE [uncultured bacterium]|nr:MAG: heat shock protein GrpE [uncultured bacterium]